VEIPVNNPMTGLDNLKMLVVEVEIDKITQSESYRLLYYYTAGEETKSRGIRLIIGGQRTL
jgi:hypothetical protein